MYLEKLPTEILYAISQEVAAFGSSRLVGLTRASRGLHAVANPVLYSRDILESGGTKSMDHGLKDGLNKVVRLCLIAGADPNRRITSHHDLDTCHNPLARTPSPLPKKSRGFLRHPPGLDDHQKVHFWTPLHVAASKGDIELLSILLDHDTNPHLAGRGVCPCHSLPLRRTIGRVISHRDQVDESVIVRRLMTRWSPLHVTVCKGNLDCAEMLIDRFGLARATESDDAVLAEARRFVREDPTLSPSETFLGRYIDRETPRFDPLLPLHVAADKYENVEALERVYAMLKRAGCLKDQDSGIDVLDAFGDTPFAVAAFSGHIQLFGSWFRDRGANINFVIDLLHGYTRGSIFNALCHSDLYRAALFLMDMGVDINLDNELHSGGRHLSALHLCCGYDSGLGKPVNPATQGDAIALIKRLIQAGTNIDAETEDGATALMSAVSLNFTAAVRELLQAKAEIGAVADYASSALHVAVECGLRQKPGAGLSAALFIIQLLLDNGADPNQRSEHSGPPLFHQVSAGGDGGRSNMAFIAPLLISRGADPNIYQQDQFQGFRKRSLVVSAFYGGHFDSLSSLVGCGTLVTCQDYLLMMSSLLDENVRSWGSNSDAVEALFRLLHCPSLTLERPERKRIMDAWTEVLYHAVGSRPRLVHALAPHVSLTDICGPGGKNVLHLMARWEQKPKEEPTKFSDRVDAVMVDLLRCGASRLINQPDNSGQSPLGTAVERGNVPVALALVNLGAAFFFEQEKPDGSTVISPLRSAIKSYSKTRQYEIAAEMLSISCSKDELMFQFCGRTGYLKDLILHFGSNPFDKPAQMESRTLGLIKKLINLGGNVNEPDEHGDTALHLLLQLLYPSHGVSRDSGTLPGLYSQPPICSLGSSLGLQPVFDTDLDRLLRRPEEWDMNMNGWNFVFDDDSDYGNPTHLHSPDPVDCNSVTGSSIYDSPIPDSNSDDQSDLTVSFNELGESVKDDSGLVPERCCTWISSFFLLLSRGASLTIRNNAGKTVLDYIDELRHCDVHTCPKMYSPIIPVLRDFVKRPPFDDELFASIEDTEVNSKGRPELFVYDHVRLCWNKDDRANASVVARQARGESRWVPFW